MSVLVRPMLAQRYTPKRFVPGMFVQPKLDGVRALYKDGRFMSRDGQEWSEKCLGHIRNYLRERVPPDTILDGELYRHNMPLQQINSRIAVKRVDPHEKEGEISYAAFDIVSRNPFGKRFETLVNLIGTNQTPPTYALACRTVQTTDDLDRYHGHMKSLGYEGSMLRHPDKPYALPENCREKNMRSFALLKRKDWLDIDATIVQCLEGEGKYQNTLGSFLLELPSGVRFSAGSGLSDTQRHSYWHQGSTLFGVNVKVQYETLSEAGVPLKPVILLVDEPKEFLL